MVPPKELNEMLADATGSSIDHPMPKDQVFDQDRFKDHLDLLAPANADLQGGETSLAPIIASSALTVPSHMSGKCCAKFPKIQQYGLLAGLTSIMRFQEEKEEQKMACSPGEDPRVFYNVTSPSSTFICGSQGSGKSHTLSCMLENCLIPSIAGQLEHLLTGLVFHYDAFISETMGSPCEAAYLSSSPEVKVRVLCSPTNIQTIRYAYSCLENVEVETLQIDECDLNTQRMLDLMAVSQSDGSMPLYMHTLLRILRELRIEQQQNGTGFNYQEFKRRLLDANLAPAQKEPLKQRLDTLESFMPNSQVEGNRGKLAARRGSAWDPVDQSVGRVVALDEAHKYMNTSAEASAFTDTLLAVVRLQRHLGARVIISTQEPTISTALLNLCSVTIVHRFTSPEWLRILHHHLAGASENCFALNSGSAWSEDDSEEGEAGSLFTKIVRLGVGEALLFGPSAIVRTSVDHEGQVTVHQLGAKHLIVKVRARLTDDGGKSVLSM